MPKDTSRPRPARRVLAAAATLAWLGVVALLAIVSAGTLLPAALLGVHVLLVVFADGGPRRVAASTAVVVVAVIGWRAGQAPSNDLEWGAAHAELARTTIDGDELRVDGVRNLRWSADGTVAATPGGATDDAWRTRRYHLSLLEGVDVIVAPFTDGSPLAHTMLSFDFGADGRLLLSIEARLEQGETYHPIAGGLNEYELAYVFMDERDGLGRLAASGRPVHAFPARVDPLRLRAFLLGLCSTANRLHEEPRFYRVVRDNCTTAWIHHADHLTETPLGLQPATILTGRIGRLLHEQGLLDTELDYEAAADAHRIDAAVLDILASDDQDDFSRRIRETTRAVADAGVRPLD